MSTKRKWRWGAALLVTILSGCGDGGGADHDLVVMTQNVYVGFDVEPILASQDPQEIPLLAAEAFAQLQATNFYERAEAMAGKLSLKAPHLIGLQEVSLIRRQTPGDAVVGGGIPAETVVFDYLEILMSALAARGLQYRVVGKVQNADVELPMLVDPAPAFDDIRLTDYDVLLARADVTTTNVAAVTYQAKLSIPTLGLEIPRGYVAADVSVGGGPVYRFATTHLEDVPFPDVQIAQAQELVAALSSESKPVILLGDFNSPAPDGATYSYLVSQGFVDAWTRNTRTEEGAGLTWGHEPSLRNAADQFTLRIDAIFVRYPADPLPFDVSAEVWGDELSERTVSGLWPSDHGGVIATLGMAGARGRGRN